jgi:hypothetical protein
MAKTQSFKKLVRQGVATDPIFAEALSREIEDLVVAGDIDTAGIVWRDYLGFDSPVPTVTKGDRPV